MADVDGIVEGQSGVSPVTPIALSVPVRKVSGKKVRWIKDVRRPPKPSKSRTKRSVDKAAQNSPFASNTQTGSICSSKFVIIGLVVACVVIAQVAAITLFGWPFSSTSRLGQVNVTSVVLLHSSGLVADPFAGIEEGKKLDWTFQVPPLDPRNPMLKRHGLDPAFDVIVARHAKNKGRKVKVERRKAPSSHEFFSSIVPHGWPVIFTDLTTDWPVITWDAEELGRRFGSEEVSVMVSS